MRTRGQKCDKRSQARCTIEDDYEEGHFFCVGCTETYALKDGHRHHVVPHVDGGLSERFNCLMICASCHVTLHGGAKKDMERIYKRVYSYMAYKYGILFLLQYPKYYELMREAAKIHKPTLKDYREFNEATKNQHYCELMYQTAPGTVHFAGNDPYKSVFTP